MKKKTITSGNLFLAFLGFLFLMSLSVVLVLNLRCIYYFDIGYLELESKTGYSEEVIRENYDALIDYNLLFGGADELEFPDFPMSENAATHFKEVKRIFVGIQILLLITGALLAVILRRKLSEQDYGGLKLTSIFTFLIPIVVGICAVTNWEAFFVGFHKLVFDNDYWLFDPVTDPVILILPDEFFAHCAAAILLFLFLGGILTGMFYRFLVRKEQRLKKGMKNL